MDLAEVSWLPGTCHMLLMVRWGGSLQSSSPPLFITLGGRLTPQRPAS